MQTHQEQPARPAEGPAGQLQPDDGNLNLLEPAGFTNLETAAANNPANQRGNHLELEKGYRQLQLLHQLTLTVSQANELEIIYEEALRGLQEAVGADRAAVLLFDEGGVMQFVAWHGLSDSYRAAAAGHSPWTREAVNPQPLLVASVRAEPSLVALADRITAEGIHALGFVPLLYQGRLMGKFMLYYDRPHDFTLEEVRLAETIAGQIALAIERRQSAFALQESYDRLEQRVTERTAELRQSELLLAQAQRLTHLGSWEWLAATNQLTWSDEVYRIYGVDPADFRPTVEKALSFLHPEDQQNSRQRLVSTRENSGPIESYNRIVRPDGRIRVLHSRTVAVHDQDGGLVKIVGAIQDVTEQRQVEESLRLSEERYRTLARNIPRAAVFLFDPDLRLILVEGDEKIHPTFYQGTEGKTVWELMPAEEYETRGRYYQEALQGMSHVYERTMDGRSLLVYVLPIQNDQGNISAVMAMAQDISEHKEAQDKLARNAQQLYSLNQELQRKLRESEALALISQALSSTLDMNLVLELIAVSAHQIIPHVEWAIIHLADETSGLLHPAAVVGLELQPGEYVLHPGEGIAGRAFEEGRVITVNDLRQDARPSSFARLKEFQTLLVSPVHSHTHRLGTISIHRDSEEPFTLEDEQLLGRLGTQVALAIENARLFKAEQKAKQRLRQLTQKVVSAQEAERRRISYDLHDEAGQALTALKINLGMLAADLPESQETLRRDLLEAKNLVSNTMEHIRLLAHDLRPPIVDSFSLNLALESMCKDFGRRTNCEVVYQGETLPALPDEVTISFYRFVQEGLTNVAKHAEANRVEVVLRREPDRIVVSVADNGRGFKPEEGEQSSGIGLAGMQERFDLLGGRLEINSVAGKGTFLTAYAPYRIEKDHD